MKGLLVVFGAVVIGNMVAEKFLLKSGPDDSGWVEASEGLGLDDAVRAGCCALAYWGVKKVLPTG